MDKEDTDSPGLSKTYNHKEYEEKIYSLWEKSGAFKETAKGKPYTILMPPPNANASLHAGHAMYTVDDILIRWRRMQGYSSLWIPGRDHAGFETQFVYEKHLAKEGKSRMDFDRQTLYNNIFKFVEDNSGLIFDQFKRLGFSADWERSVFTLDKNVIERVYETFTKMEKEGLIYRDSYIVNYCTHDGTSLAELEVKHLERVDPLYYIKYFFEDSKDKFIIVATVRPETIYGDVAIAVNPKDKRYKEIVGKKVLVPIINRLIPVVADDNVDMEFGTGAVKVTPAHDANDFQMGKKHNLPVSSVIDLYGRITVDVPTIAELKGKKVKIAREITVAALKENLDKVDENYNHAVTVCYKCNHDLEPMVMPNWFIKVDKLKEKVISAVEKEDVKFHPKRFKRHMLSWLNIMHDWPISRQIVWGIRIPVWYSINDNPKLEITFMDKDKKRQSGLVSALLEEFKIDEIINGLQQVRAPQDSEYVVSADSPGDGYLPETDTFDTWFSSGQWPLVTLKGEEFKSRFPTQVMGTLSDILKFWVSRMILFSLYLKDEVPFKDVYLWSMVADSKGIKMSKSKGNVINPIELIEKYGADSLRMSLMYGTPAGSKVILSDEKVKGMRNFSNKVWNISRFVLAIKKGEKKSNPPTNLDDKWVLEELDKTIEKVNTSLEDFKLNEAAEEIYEFIWHRFADIYIEKTKDRREEAQPILFEVLENSLKLLHPFMPFVTEAVWQEGKEFFDNPLLITATYPK